MPYFSDFLFSFCMFDFCKNNRDNSKIVVENFLSKYIVQKTYKSVAICKSNDNLGNKGCSKRNNKMINIFAYQIFRQQGFL